MIGRLPLVNTDDESPPLRFIPLGGLGEIGMNCMAVEHGDDILVIDCGVIFDSRGLGVDVVHADLGWLIDRRDRVRALVLTHGHEDHIGAVGYFLREISAPIYGPPYTLALVRERLREPFFADESRDAELRTLEPGASVRLGPFEVETFRVTHSMPECTGLAIRTPVGLVVHSGDFKIDETPPPGDHFDADVLRAYGDEGVRMLLADSTNSMSAGASGAEVDVARTLEEIVRECPERVVVGLFASNVHRMRALFEVARRTQRKVAVLGRSLDTHVRLGAQHGFLPDLGDLLVPRDKARTVARGQLLVLATGSQGEGAAALPRLAAGTHPDLDLAAGDLAIFSSRVIPGNERPILDTINALERRGIRVIHRGNDARIHVSGHAHASEQRTLFSLLRPRAFLPVHGTFVHLKAHAETARDTGVEEVVVVENGQVVELDRSAMRLAERVETGRVHVSHGEPIGARALADRALLAQLGVVLVSVVVDAQGKLAAPAEVVTRGVFDEEADPDLVRELAEEIEDGIGALRTPKLGADVSAIREAARRAVRRYLLRELGQKPLAYVHVLRLGG